jgi:hypothetical protein
MLTPDQHTLIKTIYAKSRGTFDQRMLQKVLNLEIETHLRKHPNVQFLKVEKPIRNDDMSTTYVIRFIPFNSVQEQQKITTA